MGAKCWHCEKEFTEKDLIVVYTDSDLDIQNVMVHSECKREIDNNKAGRIHACLKCNIDDKVIDPECTLCLGFGYTKDEYVPIYKIKGYEIVPHNEKEA